MKITKRDIIWSYLSIGLVHSVNLLLLPIILIYLNKSELGLWYTFSSIYSLAVILDFGLQATISRNINYIWAGNNEVQKDGISRNSSTEVNIQYFIKFLSTVKAMYFIIGVIAFIMFSTFGTMYIYSIINDKISLHSALISWALYLTAIIFNITFSYWNCLLRGIGEVKKYNQVLILMKITQLILSSIFLWFGLGIIGVSLAYLISVLINRLFQSLSFYNANELTGQLKNKIKFNMTKEIVINLIPNTIKTGITSVANFLAINSPILLCSYFLSLEMAGEFGLTNQIITLILTISNTYFNTYLPKFNYLRSKGDNYLFTEIVKKAIKYNYIIIIVGFLFLILAGNYSLGLLPGNHSIIPIKLLIFLLIFRFLYNNQTLLTSIINTSNNIPQFKSFFITSFITIIIQLILLIFVNQNLYMIIIPSLICQALFNNWYWILNYKKEMGNILNGISNE